MNFLLQWVVISLTIIITAYLLPGVHVSGVMAAVLAAVVIGLVNTLIGPVMIILTLPVNIFTLGLFILAINALLIMLSAWIVPGFTLDSFWWVILFGMVIAMINCFFGGMSRVSPGGIEEVCF